MDIFMDKLAQRLTAQDIIQANTAADMEEMNKLKAQIAEYYQCLEQLRSTLDEETARLKNSQVSSDNVNRLVDESIAKIRAIQSDSRGTEELQQQLSQQLDVLEKRVGDQLELLQKQIGDKLEILERAGGRIDALEQVGGKLDAIEQQVGGKLDAIERQAGDKIGAMEQQVGNKLGAMEQQMGSRLGAVEQQVGNKLGAMEQQLGDRLGSLEQQLGGNLGSLEQQLESRLGSLEQQLDDKMGEINRQVGENLNGLNRQVGDTLGRLERQAEEPEDSDNSKLTEKFAALEENVHKECVKVYRNVQAVVVEENSKQSDAMTETMSTVGKMKGKTGAILGISAAALLVSLGSVVLQLMQIMGIF